MSVPIIRPMRARELPEVVSLINSAYRGDSSRAGWTTEADLLDGQRTDLETLGAALDAEDTVLLVSESAAGLRGCVILDRAFVHGWTEAHLGMLTVWPEGQARGLGSALVAAAEAHARQAWQARAMRMTVIAQRSELIAWYERRGYVRTGETQAFPYHDARFGLPRRSDLHFVVLRKWLA